MSNHQKYTWLFAALGALFFLPFLGGVHLFDWDEINFAEIAREMVLTGDYLRITIDYFPFSEKPPLFFWMQAASMNLWGIGEYAARFPNAICGIITLVLLFRLGRQLYSTRFGIIWAGAYLGSVLPHLYFKSGIIDPWFNLFIFLGLYYFILYVWRRQHIASIELKHGPLYYLFWGGLIVGLGILTKGPVAYLLVSLTLGTHWLRHRFRRFVSIPHFIFFTGAALLVTLAWFGIETALHGPQFAIDFTIRQYLLFSTPDAGHGGFPGYHFVVILLGCFPISILGIRGMGRLPDPLPHQRSFRRWMLILFWVVLILFTIVKSKIVHYSSMAYFPLTFLAALTVHHIIEGNISFSRWIKVGLVAIAGLYVLVTIALPYLGNHKELLEPLLSEDPFASANLQAAVPWSGWEALAGVWLLMVIGVMLWLAHRQQMVTAFQVLFGGTAIFVTLTLVLFINNIEGYSQRAAIEFFESKTTEDCYVVTEGYKSYAHLYYTNKRPVYYADSLLQQWTVDEAIAPFKVRGWMLTGPVDKPTYIITKVHKADKLRERDDLQELYSKNGFVFFKRLDVP